MLCLVRGLVVFLSFILVREFMEDLFREDLVDTDREFTEGKGLQQGVACWKFSIWWRGQRALWHRIYKGALDRLSRAVLVVVSNQVLDLVVSWEEVLGRVLEVWGKIHYLMILQKVPVFKQGNLVGEMMELQAMGAQVYGVGSHRQGLAATRQEVELQVEEAFPMSRMDILVEEGFHVEDRVFQEDYQVVYQKVEVFLMEVHQVAEVFLAVRRAEEAFRVLHQEVVQLANHLVSYQHGLGD